MPSLKNTLKNDVGFRDDLYCMCHIFQSHECMKVLAKYGFTVSEDFKRSLIDTIEKMISLLPSRSQGLKNGILRVLKQMPNLVNYVQPETKLKMYFHDYNRLFRTVKDPEVLRKLLHNQ